MTGRDGYLTSPHSPEVSAPFAVSGRQRQPGEASAHSQLVPLRSPPFVAALDSTCRLYFLATVVRPQRFLSFLPALLRGEHGSKSRPESELSPAKPSCQAGAMADNSPCLKPWSLTGGNNTTLTFTSALIELVSLHFEPLLIASPFRRNLTDTHSAVPLITFSAVHKLLWSQPNPCYHRVVFPSRCCSRRYLSVSPCSAFVLPCFTLFGSTRGLFLGGKRDHLLIALRLANKPFREQWTVFTRPNVNPFMLPQAALRCMERYHNQAGLNENPGDKPHTSTVTVSVTPQRNFQTITKRYQLHAFQCTSSLCQVVYVQWV